MNREMIHFIMQRMARCLDNRQMMILHEALDDSLQLAEHSKHIVASRAKVRLLHICLLAARPPIP